MELIKLAGLVQTPSLIYDRMRYRVNQDQPVSYHLLQHIIAPLFLLFTHCSEVIVLRKPAADVESPVLARNIWVHLNKQLMLEAVSWIKALFYFEVSLVERQRAGVGILLYILVWPQLCVWILGFSRG